MILDGAVVIAAAASIRSSDMGIVAYVADSLEQTLLLPKDMNELRQMRKNEVFLTLKKEFTLVRLLSNSSSIFFHSFIFFTFNFSELSMFYCSF